METVSGSCSERLSMKKQRGNGAIHFPRGVARRILARAARGEKRVVVVLKNGRPSAVWGLQEYLDRQNLTRKVKPWEQRKAEKETPDPLGAIDAEPPKDLTRESMYENED
jgi:hypothetical protein